MQFHGSNKYRKYSFVVLQSTMAIFSNYCEQSAPINIMCVCWRWFWKLPMGGFWPIPPIQDTQIVGYRITALRHIADGRPRVSPIGANGQNRPTHHPYLGSVTSNLIAASCSGDLPTLSRKGDQRGSSWMRVNSCSVLISCKPTS